MSQHSIKLNSDLSIEEQEYLKDIWNIKVFGVIVSGVEYTHTVNFKKIKQSWLKQSAKSYAKYSLAVNSYATVRGTITVINQFSKFISQRHSSLQASEINRQLIVEFLGYLAEILPNSNSRSTRVHNFNTFLRTCQRGNWLGISREPLIYKEDFPKIPELAPKFIPQEVLDQLNKHIDSLPKPVARMLLVLQECGMRVSELCTLKFGCIAQDAKGDWWLTYYQFKMKKEHSVPISSEIAEVVRQQQEYIRVCLGSEFTYLFCGRERRGGEGENFIPVPRQMKYLRFRGYFDKLAKEKNIRDASGNIFPLGKTHQFRHTKGTDMINNGVPIHVIKKFFGWESYTMVVRYAHIYNETLKQAMEEYHENKVVNVVGEVISSERPELDTADMQWFKHNLHAQALPNGYCGLPKALNDCPHANACLTCGHFRTTKEFLGVHKEELNNTNKVFEKAKINGWERQIEMNEKVKQNLVNIITSLESEDGE